MTLGPLTKEIFYIQFKLLGTGYIVAVSVTYDVGNEVRAMVELHKAVQVYISPGSTIRSGSVRLRNMCTVWIFTIAFNVFRTSI